MNVRRSVCLNASFLKSKTLLFLFSSLRNLTRLLYPADEEDKIKEADETNKDDVEVELKNQFDVLNIIHDVMMVKMATAMVMMTATAMVMMVTWRWSLRSSWTSCTSSLVFDVSPFSVISPTTLGFSVLGSLQGHFPSLHKDFHFCLICSKDYN